MNDRIVLWSGGDREPDEDLNVVAGDVLRVVNEIGAGHRTRRPSSVVMRLERQLDHVVTVARWSCPIQSTGR